MVGVVTGPEERHDEATVRREVLHLDPELVLPAPAPLAAPIYSEPVPPPLLFEPVLWDEDGETLPSPLLAAPVLLDDPEPDVDTNDGVSTGSTEPDTEPLPPLTRPRWFRSPVIELTVLGAVAVIVAAGLGGISWLGAGVALLLIAATGITVLAFEPVLVFCAMALFLGAAPGVQTPVLGVSVTFVLSGAVWIALAVMPEVRHRVSWAAGLSAILVGTAVFALLGNPITGASVSDFVRWSVTVAAVYPLSVLPREQLARVGRWFVGGCAFAAVFGLGLLAIDRDGSRLDSLTVLGYSPDGNNGRYVFGPEGNIPRLTGTYVDPNLGGFLMAVGLFLALALLRGRVRVITTALLMLAIALTLSRADIGTVAMAGVVLVLFSGLSGTVRSRLFWLGVVASAALVAVPAVRTRLTNSFGSNDRGSSARWEAIEILPDQMAGHWLLGRGFGAPELIDANAAAATNYVANAPLLSVYRGGLVVGFVFTVLMLVAAAAAWRLLRQSKFEGAVVGAGYFGVMIVALQLDFPVVTLSPATLVFALLLAFLARPEVLLHEEPGAAEDTEDAAELDPAEADPPPEARDLEPAHG